MSLEFNRFYYETKGSFRGLDLLSQLIGLAKGYTSLKPIEDKSIPILMHKELTPEQYQKPESLEMFVHYALCSGTKPFDMIAYIASQQSSGFTRLELFDFKVGKYDATKQTAAVALLAAAIVIFVSRGSFPAQDESRGRTPLPAFVKAMLSGIDTEKNLADRLGSFDFKHIDVTNFFEDANLAGWDEIISNRLNLGVAGHKPLKVATEFAAKFAGTAKTPAEKYVAMLIQLHNESKGGFYPTLHPAQQSFATKYKGFYVQSLAAIYDAIPGDKAEKLRIMKTSNALKNEKLFELDASNEVKIATVPRIYQSWKLEDMMKEIGKFKKFEAGKLAAGAPLIPAEGEVPIAPKPGLTIGKK